jgi:GH24 family phage-related lysozyme (muramidase)
MSMTISENGIALIKKFEGCPTQNGYAVGYLDCANVPTIGWGHTGTIDEKPIYVNQLISLNKATEILKDDLKKYESKIQSFCNQSYLTQNKLDALISFELNTGAAKSSTIFTLFNQGDMMGAADQLLKWNKAGGKIITGLTKRRIAERTLFVSDNLIATTSQNVSSTISEDTIKSVQLWLKEYDATIVIDGKAGYGTRRALAKALQSELNNLGAHLKIDGVIGVNTLLAIEKYGLLKSNYNNNLVKVLESYLYIKGYNPHEFTGTYDHNLKDCIMEYQSSHALPSDGICGKYTWNKLIG